eukprot:NODE_8723_length_1474_cov_3.291017.p1 GENE.NODE_8723_length_1474_cov_3.291017~~NODE_8723_length_1474_cov_3.291017.p1  ORF type:complete len:331 (-),score=51.29 NODE_8723_length_1474_cov_3.291017:280-1272(-)
MRRMLHETGLRLEHLNFRGGDTTSIFAEWFAKGSLGMAETFMDGQWELCRITLKDLFLKIGRLSSERKHRLFRTSSIAPAVLRMGSKLGAWSPGEWRRRRSITHHYDVRNALFQSFLDPTMMCSCAYWGSHRHGSAALEQAEWCKLNLIAKKLQLEEGMRVLNIGCGWGYAAQHLEEHYGVDIVGTTTSEEQLVVARQREGAVKRDSVRFLNEDYCNIEGLGRFHRIYPFEHEGYFKVCRHASRDEGLMLVHTIGAVRPFRRVYISPGGHIAAVQEIANAAAAMGWTTEDMHNFGPDHEATLDVTAVDLPENEAEPWAHFVRMWRYISPW